MGSVVEQIKMTSVNHIAHSRCSVKAVMLELSSWSKRNQLLGHTSLKQPTGKPQTGTWGNPKLWIPGRATCGHHGDIWLQDLALVYATCRLPRTQGLPRSRVYLADGGGQGFSAWWDSGSNPALAAPSWVKTWTPSQESQLTPGTLMASSLSVCANSYLLLSHLQSLNSKGCFTLGRPKSHTTHLLSWDLQGPQRGTSCLETFLYAYGLHEESNKHSWF